jgi:hypothetical protein
VLVASRGGDVALVKRIARDAGLVVERITHVSSRPRCKATRAADDGRADRMF